MIDSDTFESVCDDVAGHLNAQMGRLLDLTIWLTDADKRDWQGDGLWTPQQYLAWRCAIGPHLARNLVAAARRADELPVAIDALRRGELSFDQLMPIVNTIPAWADGQVTSLATRLTVTQIRRLVRDTDWTWEPGPANRDDEGGDTDVAADNNDERAAASDSETTEADPTPGPEPEPDPNRVSYGVGPDGRWWLHADLDLDLGALVENALDEARDAVFTRENRGSDPGATFRVVSDVDALIELAQRSLDTIAEPTRRNRYRVNLHLDLDARVRTDRGDMVPDSIARLLTCDGAIDPIYVEDGVPISVGRTQRSIPDRTRRSILHRDQHCCQVPGCSSTRGLEIHHIQHWADGGGTDTANLLTLCARHHRMHHKHRLGINGNPDQQDTMVFTNARGHPIRASGAHPHPPDAPPPPTRGDYEHPLGERLDSRWVTFIDPTIPRHLRHQHPDLRRPDLGPTDCDTG
ncbi:MAG: DUF222 domain-containing protein [Ilumatobacter sp.]